MTAIHMTEIQTREATVMSDFSPLKALHPAGTQYREVGDTSVAGVYGDFDTEYKALRSHAAVFDHTSVGLFSISGGGAVDFLQGVLARDIEFLTPELCTPSLILDDTGAVVDIVTVYALEDRFLLETSFGRRAATRAHLSSHRSPDVDIDDLHDRDGVIAIEGPYSWGVVGRLIDPELTALPYQTVQETSWEGRPIHFARAGFTGEYGYKVLGPVETLSAMWEHTTVEIPAAGFDVLETAMVEVRQPLVHRECRPGTNLVEAGLNWLLDRSKDGFVGRDAVAAMWEAGPRSLTVGGRCAGPVMDGAAVFAGDRPIGTIGFSVPSPGVDGVLALALLDPAFAAAGLELQVQTATGPMPLTTMSSPYLAPASWAIPIF